MMDISKNDWKLFRVKLADWQEKYMERLIKEYVTALTDETRLASDKFWELKTLEEDLAKTYVRQNAMVCYNRFVVEVNDE